MKWSWFKVPVKIEQINEYLFSDTVQSQWKQKDIAWGKQLADILDDEQFDLIMINKLHYTDMPYNIIV